MQARQDRQAAEQLERARLVAWLRRLGMPLARIRTVCALEPGPAAREIRAYWAGVEAETATRRDLAAFLMTRKGGIAEAKPAEKAAGGPAAGEEAQAPAESGTVTRVALVVFGALGAMMLVTALLTLALERNKPKLS